MKENSEYTVVTFENADEIGQKIRENGGYILILKNHSNYINYQMFDASIDLYHRPKIWTKTKPRKEFSLSVDRGTKEINGEQWQTNWENDRSYLLREIPRPTGDIAWDCARELFDRLTVDDKYEFKIGFQSCVGQGYWIDSPQQYHPKLILYVPAMKYMEPAFKEIIQKAISEIESGLKELKKSFKFNPESVGKILEYIMQDLKDLRVLKKNVTAGQDADVMVGI